MPVVTVVASLTVKAEAVAVVEVELLKLVTLTRAETGCREYRLHRDNSDPTRFFFYENWQDAACLDRHLNAEHFKRYLDAVGDLIVAKDVRLMTEIV